MSKRARSPAGVRFDVTNLLRDDTISFSHSRPILIPLGIGGAVAKSQVDANPVILKRGIGIGSGNAENDDEFLFDCFVDYPERSVLNEAGKVSGRAQSAVRTVPDADFNRIIAL